VSVTIHAPARLATLFAVQPQDDWVQDHRLRLQRLQRIRRLWPSGVVETSPMVYEWSPDRGN
jgi:hypothetical protein